MVSSTGYRSLFLQFSFAREPSSRAFVASFDSCTFGWSNGLMPSRQPANAVAISHRKNSAPRSWRSASLRYTTGWPAASSASNFALASSSSGQSLIDNKNSIVADRLKHLPAASPTIGTIPFPSLPVLSATSCSIHKTNSGQIFVGNDRQFVASGESAFSHRCTKKCRRVLSTEQFPLDMIQPSPAPACSNRSTSNPISAAGTMPKYESAE